ncbi:unnamed protein product [Ceutorhynchus assimilis]|uniref:C2H2-type domain-containing protein n=1 Tax=Ceutorhynchus assimilis TaxID=467358 RepID=A0A9P0GQK9_9CUCU|nr:unnamed protein product [Ceutorhynchus assimilis]
MNRRMGGGNRLGGNNRPNFSQQPFHSGGGGVNPWQGGGGNQGGLIPQLSNQSLALALTSLLQPQQQQHHQQPPSLLSLNTAGGFSNNYGNRFGGGGISRNRDIRRHEPYNKNRGNFGRKRSPPRNQKGNQQKKAKTDGKKKDEKKPDGTTTGEEEENTDSKRDWKDEKNGESKEGGDAEKEPANKEGKYAGVPSKYLNCFVCNKQMWDGESMAKHVRGRAHHEMLKALEESIHICVNILRENLRLAEERKAIEYNRQNRQRKFSQRRGEPPMSHCAMCDLKFMGKIVIHRRGEGHQRLKRYLHPTCRMCDKEYPSRIEWIEHCLTPEHLKRVHESTEKKLGGKDGDEIVEGGENEEEEPETENNVELNLDPLLDETLNMEGEDVILEVDDNLENLTNRLPAYKKDRPLATNSLSEFVGWKCDLCHRSFADQDDADAHLKTKKHFYRFIEVIKEKHDREEKRKKAEKDAALKAEREAKIKENGEKEGEVAEEVAEEGGEEAEGDQEMYDPSEATEEAPIKEEKVEDSMDTSVPEEKLKEDQEVTKATPPVTPRVTRKTPAPKSKRGAKK